MIQLVLNNTVLNFLGQSALNSRILLINYIGVFTLLFVSLGFYGMECILTKLKKGK